jgi:hypothetical protein
MHILTGFVVCSLLFAAVISHNLKDWLFFGGVAVFLIVFAQVCLRSGQRDILKLGKTWKMANAGLQRIYPSAEAEIIRWEQIRHMKWVRFYGLIVRWEETKAEHQHRSATFRDEFQWDWVYRQYRTTLRVQKEEARELISLAENKTGMSYKRMTA